MFQSTLSNIFNPCHDMLQKAIIPQLRVLLGDQEGSLCATVQENFCI